MIYNKLPTACAVTHLDFQPSTSALFSSWPSTSRLGLDTKHLRVHIARTQRRGSANSMAGTRLPGQRKNIDKDLATAATAGRQPTGDKEATIDRHCSLTTDHDCIS